MKRSILLAALAANEDRQDALVSLRRIEDLTEEIADLEEELDALRFELNELEGKADGSDLSGDEAAELAALEDERRRIMLALEGRGAVVIPQGEAQS